MKSGAARKPVVLSWSGGKDSAMAAYELMRSERFKIVALLTTVTEGYNRISMHGVRVELLEEQALSLKTPLRKVMIPRVCTNDIYEARMTEALAQFKPAGVAEVAFGDLFLEDLKRYRDDRLARIGMTGVYPLWRRDTNALVRRFIGLGFKAMLSCVDGKALDGSFAGRLIDDALLRDLPAAVDPCGENGEFHSFVFEGPIFSKAIKCRPGQTELRDERFYYCDIVPESAWKK